MARPRSARNSPDALARSGSGAFGAIRRAALGLAGSDGQSTFSHQQLLSHPAAAGYAETTLIDAIQEHANGRDGVLTRLQVGVYRLRRAGLRYSAQ